MLFAAEAAEAAVVEVQELQKSTSLVGDIFKEQPVEVEDLDKVITNQTLMDLVEQVLAY